MAEPDFAKSRRQLRRARIQSALTMPRQGVVPRVHRDRLLELLAFGRLADEVAFGQLAEDQVETIVAVALADVADDPQDRAFILLECVSILARDGQFARVKLLGSRLAAVAKLAAEGRSYLELSLNAIAFTLGGNSRRALSDLNQQLGIDGEAIHRASREVRRDVALAGAIRATLTDAESDVAGRLRDTFTRLGDGLAMSALDCAIAWQQASTQAHPLRVLREVDDLFAGAGLERYVNGRGISVLFPAQVTAIHSGLTRDIDLMVSLPTSSGKTLLAEFRIAATLARDPEATVIYVAPYRLLARQVERSLSRGLSQLRHVVQDLGTGFDVETPTRFGNVLVCTPERLDALLRQASRDPDVEDVFARCALVVFDEMHLIGRSGRGPRFEMILARLKLRFPRLRFLALSAASQGVDEVAEWLTGGQLVRSGRRPTGTIEVTWRTDGTLAQRVDRHASTIVGELERKTRPIEDAALLISRLSSEYRPVLAVCVQRAYAESLAINLVESDPIGNRLWLDSLGLERLESLNAVIEAVASVMGNTHPLTHCLRQGVGFHHAGVPTSVLGMIEELAASGVLRAVSATTTVAEGADLPFRAVVIPHLNFQGNSRRLERDLYLNIIGRAGRVNVAMEGIVFILDSAAETLRNHVSANLWTTAEVGRVRGQLPEVTAWPQSADASSWFGEFESQVMGWLGDGDSYHDGQAERLASATFTYSSGSSTERSHVRDLTQTVLESLEQRGFAVAASPYRLTDSGTRARLTGLRSDSAARLERVIEVGADGWLAGLEDSVELSAGEADEIARTVFESSETMTHSLWLRRNQRTEVARASWLHEFARQRAVEHYDSEVFWAEVAAVSRWMQGESFESIADAMPVFGGNGLFGSRKVSSRVSDVAEYVSRIGYPGGWTWSATATLASAVHGLGLPAWVSSAVEYGASSETAVQLMRVGRMSRPGALRLAVQLGPSWSEAVEQLRQEDPEAGLGEIDDDRLAQLQFLLRDEA